MASTISLSKGCFVFKNGKKRKRAHDESKKKLYLLSEDAEPAKGEELRLTSYQKFVDAVDQDVKDLERSHHISLFEQIQDFADKASSLKFGFSKELIPTAVLVTGINMPDHNRFFGMLSDHLQENCSPLVSRLNPKTCTSIKALIQNLVGQIIKGKEDLMPYLEDEHEVEEIQPGFLTKPLVYSLETLCAWYKEKFKNSEGNVRNCNGRRDLVFIIFEEFEGFSVPIIGDAITLISGFRKIIPFVFVFGVATSSSVVQEILRYPVSSCVAIENFQTPPSVHFLNTVLDKVLFSKKLPFKLGSKVFNLLMDLFLYHDFAVSNFVNNLKFCMLEHYFSSKASVLCCDISEMKKRIKLMNPEDLIVFQTLPSCSRIPQSKVKDNADDICFKFRETYIMAFGSLISDTDAYKTAFQLLRLSSREELTKRVSETVVTLNAISTRENVNTNFVQDQLAHYLHQLQTVGDMLIETEEENPTINIGKKMSKAELQEVLLEAAKNKKISPFERVRDELLDFLDIEFKKNLRPPTEFPFHEVYVFDAVQSVKRHLIGAPRSALQVALVNPHLYLQCDCCRIEDSAAVEKSMPDTCIAYKVHLECGKLINLYDWLQSFGAIVDPENSEDGISKNTQARFSQAVSELQYTGFIKQSKRKVDHVARTTFGNS
ncbi:origin recognition complex subunit 3-like isoform X2 [Artemia franciscana]|uniref:origin recognition complex subunit 3-like isoform X2 n=1 Tax=Artemia franciscana TaxID=6661 RepID=UPI0032D9B30F